MNFLGHYGDIIQQIEKIDACIYAQNRNYLQGSVTQLSPFIIHGVIDTQQVMQSVMNRMCLTLSYEEAYQQAEKFIFQLAWRDFFHRVWQHQGEHIFSDLRHPQEKVESTQLPAVIVNANTGIKIIDAELKRLYQTGYIHNHSRLWIASLVANMTNTDWRTGAKWMHHHLLDGDLASNTLSWQWVAGTFSQKRYLANQDNLNRFSSTQQQGTPLDVSYEALAAIDLPSTFSERIDWQEGNESVFAVLNSLRTNVAIKRVEQLKVDVDQTLYLHSIYHLDSQWHCDEGQHVLLIEPERLQEYPLSKLRWQFILHWAEKITGVQVLVGSSQDVFSLPLVQADNVVFQENSACLHWQGRSEPRPWLFETLAGDYSSFFKFWNSAQKQVQEVGIQSYFKLNDSQNLRDKTT